ncbi:MAG: hypothetical protein RL030_2789 [Pseudomonadota bacterium]|jgi:hypothetical protein
MRINVYSQELTSEVKLISKESDGRKVTGIPCLPNGEASGEPREELPDFLVEVWEKNGRPAYQDATNPFRDVREDRVTYSAVQLMLHSSPMLHHPPEDDDRSAVTIWLPKSKERRKSLARALQAMAALVLSAPSETGLD